MFYLKIQLVSYLGICVYTNVSRYEFRSYSYINTKLMGLICNSVELVQLSRLIWFV
jgi:hypothetical protein